jgi:hypothetical protein
MSNIIRLAYCVAPRGWIERLVTAGYLRPSQRNDPDAVQAAVEQCRQGTAEFLAEQKDTR